MELNKRELTMMTISFKLLTIALSIIFIDQLHTAVEIAEPLSDKESVLLYCDAAYQGSLKDVKSTYKDNISDKKVKWKVKKAKYLNFTQLAENIEKELLKSKADRFIIALGHSEVWDFKKNQATEIDLAAYQSSIESIVSTLSKADKHIMLCTPHQLSAGQNDKANERLEAASNIIKSVAANSNAVAVDLYTYFSKKNANGDPGKHNKGITTKDGIKLNDTGVQIVVNAIGKQLGLSASGPSKKANIGRKLKKGDVIMFLVPSYVNHATLPLHNALKSAHKAEMSVLAPRAMDISLAADGFFAKETPKLDVIVKSNPSIIILYPGSYFIGPRKHFDKLESGEFQAALRNHIQSLQEKTKAEILVCTPLLWAEDNNQIVIDGPNYQGCQTWADKTRAVANEFNLGVIDLHQKCLNYVQKNGAGKDIFAGRKNVWQGQTTYNDLDYTDFAKDFYLDAVAEAINFDYQSHKK